MKKLIIAFCVFIQVIIGMPMIKGASYGWGFKRNNTHTCPDIGIYEDEIAGTSTYYVGSLEKKEVYLTFDAGYDNGNLSLILDILKEKAVKSTFFVTGDFIRRENELLIRLSNEGHLVGNHTWSHPDITKLSFQDLTNELRKVEEAYLNSTGRKMAPLFRPPSGIFNRTSLLDVQKLGYTTVFWSIAYRDWETNKQQGKDYAINHILNNLHNGAIILLHTVSKDNVQALPKIIDAIRGQEYQIKNLDSLVNYQNFW